MRHCAQCAEDVHFCRDDGIAMLLLGSLATLCCWPRYFDIRGWHERVLELDGQLRGDAGARAAPRGVGALARLGSTRRVGS